MRIFGIDPGSDRTGYGCVETDGRRHRLVICGAITSPAQSTFPERLLRIHAGLAALLAEHQAGMTVAEYSPAEIKRAVVGFGRAEKHQVGQMIKLLLELDVIPVPHDAADALAVALCHVHSSHGAIAQATAQAAATTGRRSASEARLLTSWRDYRP